MDDELLTDYWEACTLRRAISHDEHIRISRVLMHRHGSEEATRRLVEGTRANCIAMGVAERFDESLTIRWSRRIAAAVERSQDTTYEAFISAHPELSRSDLLGLPAWKMRAG